MDSRDRLRAFPPRRSGDPPPSPLPTERRGKREAADGDPGGSAVWTEPGLPAGLQVRCFRPGQVDRPGDGAGKAGRGGMAKLEGVAQGVSQGFAASGDTEHKVTVQRRMRWDKRAGHAVMGGHGHAVGLRLGQRGVGRDDGDGCRLSQAFARQGDILRQQGGGAEAAERVTSATRLWVHATSFGGVESLLERRRRWPSERPIVPDNLVRLSVGLEDVDDLWDDLDAALRAATRP